MGADVGKCQTGEKYDGLWEVPLYQAQEGDNGDTLLGVGSESPRPCHSCCLPAPRQPSQPCPDTEP